MLTEPLPTPALFQSETDELGVGGSIHCPPENQQSVTRCASSKAALVHFDLAFCFIQFQECL